MKVWLIGSVLLFGLIGAPFFLVVGALCGGKFLTCPNQVVSDVSVRRVVPLVFTFVVLFSEMSVLWPMDATVFIQGAAQGVPRVPFLQFWPPPGLHFRSSGDPLG